MGRSNLYEGLELIKVGIFGRFISYICRRIGDDYVDLALAMMKASR